MKTQTPEEYATELIEKYTKLDSLYNSPVDGINLLAIQCAIIDVENTIEYIKSDEILMDVLGDEAPDIIYFNEVITILKTNNLEL